MTDTIKDLGFEALEDERAHWRESPYSRRLERQLIEQEVMLINMLIGTALESTDPKVVALAHRIVSARQFREHFEPPKVEKEPSDESR